MARYKVLRPIEHNQKLYLPEVTDALPSVKSAGNGRDISVEASGIIELSEQEAVELVDGQIPLGDGGKPQPIEEARRVRAEDKK